MHTICLTPLEEGVYNDHKSDYITEPPEGWAMIPDDMEKPSTFPRLGSLEAEEITYPYEVEVEKDVEKTRQVPQYDDEGNMLAVMVTETYTEKEIVKEQRERVIMTVTKMTEGALPEPAEPEPTDNELQWQAITDLEIAQMEYEQALTDLEIAQLEG